MNLRCGAGVEVNIACAIEVPFAAFERRFACSELVVHRCYRLGTFAVIWSRRCIRARLRNISVSPAARNRG